MSSPRDPADIFVTSIFEGRRFDNHTLPLDAVGELSTYARFILDVAKHLYMRENPSRQRVPKGFAESLNLSLANISRGSAAAELCRTRTDGNLPFPDHFDQARDLINRCIDSIATGQEFPDDFPASLLYHFDRFGRTLAPEEDIVLVVPSDRCTGVRYTHEVRKRLVLKTVSNYHSKIRATGTVVEADVLRNSFQVQIEGNIIRGTFQPEFKNDILLALQQHDTTDVSLIGEALYDSQDRIVQIVSLQEIAPFSSLRPFDLRIQELKQFLPGWLEGQGNAVSPNALFVADIFRSVLEEKDLPLPFVYPTPEGGIQMEWSTSSSLEVTLTIGETGDVFLICCSPHGEDVQELEPDQVSVESATRLLSDIEFPRQQ